LFTSIKVGALSLVTDYKALIYIKDKSDFRNKRICRWIERIQDYDFDIPYKKGEEVLSADVLSRLYESEKTNTDNIVKGDEYLKEFEKIEIIRKIHEKLLQKGKSPLAYEVKKKYKWNGLNSLIEETIKTCEV
jgi:hypothetical protein